MKPLILGVGNILLSDEGVGVRVVQELEKRPDTFGHRGIQGLAGLVVAFDAKLVLGAHALPRVIGGCVVGVSLLKTVLLGVLDVPGTVLSSQITVGCAFRIGSLDGVVLPVFGEALLHGN